MSVPGEIKNLFGRQYIYMNPGPFPGTTGGWRLNSGDVIDQDPIELDFSFNAVVGGSNNIAIGNLVYLNASGEVELASALSIDTSQVAGVAVTHGVPGETIKFVRNVVQEIVSPNTVLEGAASSFVAGETYYLSTVAGKWTDTPNTVTDGCVVRSCGVALDGTNISVEIQIATVI